jgi:hypothetical protein
MRRILDRATAGVIVSAVVALAFASAATEELSTWVVSDIKATTITGGNNSGCNSTVTRAGTTSCLTTSCPMDNYRAGGAGNSGVSTQNCGDCTCTFVGTTCN